MNARVTEVDDEGAELSSLGEDIKVCSLNINGLKADKVKYIAWYVRRHSIDVLFLQDTQLTVQTAHWRKAELKQELGENCYITSSAREESQLYTNIGGQMVIVMPQWAPDIANVDTTDASSMGVVMAVYLKTKIGTLMILSTYWPYDSDPEGNGLAAGLTRWMVKCNRSGSAKDYIQDRIHKLILNQQSNSSNSTIVCGDFNACYHKHTGRKASKQIVAEHSAEKLVDDTEKEAPEVGIEISNKPPSKAFKKNWSRRQAGRGRGKGSKKGGPDEREIDPEALKLISSQKSWEPWVTHCCLGNPVADYCHSNNRIMYTRYCGEMEQDTSIINSTFQ